MIEGLLENLFQQLAGEEYSLAINTLNQVLDALADMESPIQTIFLEKTVEAIKQLDMHFVDERIDSYCFRTLPLIVKDPSLVKEQLFLTQMMGDHICRQIKQLQDFRKPLYYYIQGLALAEKYGLRENIESFNQRIIDLQEHLLSLYSAQEQKLAPGKIDNRNLNDYDSFFLDFYSRIQGFIDRDQFKKAKVWLDLLKDTLPHADSDPDRKLPIILDRLYENFETARTNTRLQNATYTHQMHRNRLQILRKDFYKQIKDQKIVTSQQLMYSYTMGLKSFLQTMIEECIKELEILGDKKIPLGGYQLRGMGSWGRLEVCPYSDLEIMALVSSAGDIPYFKALLSLLEIKIIALGETAPPESIPHYPLLGSHIKSGLHIDEGGNPLNDPGLIGYLLY